MKTTVTINGETYSTGRKNVTHFSVQTFEGETWVKFSNSRENAAKPTAKGWLVETVREIAVGEDVDLDAEVAEAPVAEVTEVLVEIDMVSETHGHVEIFTPGRVLSGEVLHDAVRNGKPGAGWSAEDRDGNVIVQGRNHWKAAAVQLARHLGVTGPLKLVRYTSF